jgi:hypothetical protein
MQNCDKPGNAKRQSTSLGIALLALLLIAGGYGVGKNMAHRDNARAAAAPADAG